MITYKYGSHPYWVTVFSLTCTQNLSNEEKSEMDAPSLSPVKFQPALHALPAKERADSHYS